MSVICASDLLSCIRVLQIDGNNFTFPYLKPHKFLEAPTYKEIWEEMQ